MIGFKKPTFICLDLPTMIAEKIRKIRLDLDPDIAWKPAVVTIAGSSGCGRISYNQDIFEANHILADISKNTPPILAQFSKLSFFSDTNIYFFEFKNESLINYLHEKIKNCGIKFIKNDYPFKAHCTIHFKGLVNAKKEIKIINTIIPHEKFEINTISLISNYKHLSRFTFNGEKNYEFEGV